MILKCSNNKMYMQFLLIRLIVKCAYCLSNINVFIRGKYYGINKNIMYTFHTFYVYMYTFIN